MRELRAETPRLRIGPLEDRDRGVFCALFTDEETMHFVGSPLPREKALEDFEAALRVSRRDPPRQIFMRVACNDDPEDGAIGICSIQQIDLERRRAEVGLMLEPRHRAHGLGRESICALVRAAFDAFPIDEIWAQYDARHIAAERLFIGAGFSSCAHEGADTDGVRWRIRSVYRQSWEGQDEE